MQQKMDELAKENADLKEQQHFYVPLVKVSQSKVYINSWRYYLVNILQPNVE
jgi:hypothetical protein